MWEKLIQAIRDFVFVSELSRRNADEIKELRKRNEEITLLVERLAFEVQIVGKRSPRTRETDLEVRKRSTEIPKAFNRQERQ